MNRSLVVVFAVITLFGAGCFPEKLNVEDAVENVKMTVQDAVKEAAERGTEEVAKQKIGADVDFDVTGGGATLTDPITGKTISVGSEVRIPSNFPDDVPVFPDGIPTSLSLDPNKTDASLLLMTNEGRTAIREWYAGVAPDKGWTEEGALETADRVVLSYVNAGAKLTVTIMPPNLQKQVGILLLRKGE